MAQINVVWTKTADRQLVETLEYWVIRNRSSVFSLKLMKLVSKRTKQIAKNPYSYKLANFSNTRIAPLENYSIFYKISQSEIIITAFWDNRQDPKVLFKILNG